MSDLEKESLIDALRRAAASDRPVTITGAQAEMLVALVDIVAHAKYEANAATMLAGAVVSRLRQELVK